MAKRARPGGKQGSARRNAATASAGQGAKGAARKRKKPLVSYSELEIHDLLALIPTRSPTGRRNRAIIATLFGSGVRVSELCDLKAHDVEQRKDGNLLVRVHDGKNESRRVVPLIASMRPVLFAWLETRASIKKGRRNLRGDDPLFVVLTTGVNKGTVNLRGGVVGGAPMVRGNPLSTDAVRVFLSRLQSKAETKLDWSKRLHPHGMRHSYTRWCVEHGFATTKVQRWLGHTNLATTDTYTQTLAISEADLAEFFATSCPAPDVQEQEADAELRAVLDALRALPAEQRRTLARALLDDKHDTDQPRGA